MLSAAQGKIAYHSFGPSDGSAEIYLMDADGSNRINLTNTGGNDVWPSISPDGSKITFQSNRDGNNEVYVMNIDGSNQVRLTNNSASDDRPSYGPNGKIVFHSFRDGNGEIYIMNDDGTGQERLTWNTVSDFNASVSHDGTKIVFVVQLAPGIDTDIYFMNTDGTGRERLTFDTAYEGSPSFSPDDERIVYQKGLVSGGEIWTMTAAGGGFAQLTDNSDHDENPTFSPDGSQIAFQSDRGIYPLSEIYTMNANGSNQTRITNNAPTNGGLNGAPSWGVDPNRMPTISPFDQSVAADSTGSFQIGSVADSEDNEEDLSVTVNGGASATVNGVTVSGLAVSPAGGLTANISATCGAADAGFTLRVTDSGSLYQEATLNVSVTPEAEAPELTLPSDIVTSLPLNSSDVTKEVTFAVSATDNCDPSPQVVADPPSGSAFSVGTTTVNVTATDASGNTSNRSFTVTVLYNFHGFFQPIENLPVINTATAGQGIPIKFSLSGNKGLNIFAAGFPVSQQIACSSGDPTAAVDETVNAGGSSLSYDTLTDQYIYVWKTERGWKGTCRQLIVRLNDGSNHLANFQFR